MDRLVIYGAGNMARNVWQLLQRDKDLYHVIAVIDSDKEKQRENFEGMEVMSPDVIKKLEYDKLIIAIASWREVFIELQTNWNIPSEKLENGLFLYKKKLFQYYRDNMDEINPEMREVLAYLENHPMDVLNYEFVEGYNGYRVEIHYDEECQLYYTMYYGKRMYMSSAFKTAEQVRNYCQNIAKEQDVNSPHSYAAGLQSIKKGCVVIDAGVAEGNFSLLIVDSVKKLYLVEADPEWAEALKHTFAPYGDKVEIVNKYLSNKNDSSHITIDTMCKDVNIDAIKLDVEGCELEALYGAVSIVKKSRPLLIVCSYHEVEAENRIRQFVGQIENCKYQISTTNGYMIFIIFDNMLKVDEVKMVRGVVIGLHE